MAPKPKMKSFERSSLIVQFNIIFILISIIPLSLLYYLYLQLRSSGRIQLTVDNLNATIFYVAIGIGVGYFLMRLAVVRILRLTKANQEALKSIIGAEGAVSTLDDANEVMALTQTFNEAIGKLKDNIMKLELAKNTLQGVLSKVGQGISSIQNIDKFLDLIIETITEAVGGRAGALLMIDDDQAHLYVRTYYGSIPGSFKQVLFSCRGSFLEDVLNRSKAFLILSTKTLIADQHFESPLMAVPLVLHDKVLGVLVVSGRKIQVDFNHEDIALLHSVAMQTAVAIENDRLHVDAERSYFDIISALAVAVEAKDPYSRGHLDRVSDYAVKIAAHLGLSEEEKSILRDAGRLHDLGKIGVNDDVLLKQGPFTTEERIAMESHPALSEEIIKPIKSLGHLRDVVRHHHEKLDGSGYPDRLKGDQINPLVRILAVADIYDALRTSRPYRKGLSQAESFQILREMGLKIDQHVVDALASVLAGTGKKES